jgi:hypothetical protein
MRNIFNISDKGHTLCCIQAYVELNIWASFDLHTEISIKKGREVAEKFIKLANVSRL